MSVSDASVSATGQLHDHERLRTHVEGVRERAAKAVPWGPDTVGMPPHEDVSPLLHINDVAFYANARQEVTTFADVCLRLLNAHRPHNEDNRRTTRRCRCCMLQWPCPTIREMGRLLD